MVPRRVLDPSPLASGFLDGLRFFDATGTMHEVIRVIPRTPPTLLDRLFNRRVTVALELRAMPPSTVHDVASLLCGIIDGDPDDLYDQERSPDELKASFRSAPDAAALIARARTLGG